MVIYFIEVHKLFEIERKNYRFLLVLDKHRQTNKKKVTEVRKSNSWLKTKRTLLQTGPIWTSLSKIRSWDTANKQLCKF